MALSLEYATIKYVLCPHLGPHIYSHTLDIKCLCVVRWCGQARVGTARVSLGVSQFVTRGGHAHARSQCTVSTPRNN